MVPQEHCMLLHQLNNSLQHIFYVQVLGKCNGCCQSVMLLLAVQVLYGCTVRQIELVSRVTFDLIGSHEQGIRGPPLCCGATGPEIASRTFFSPWRSQLR